MSKYNVKCTYPCQERQGISTKIMNCVSSDTVQLKNVHVHTAKARRARFMKHEVKMELAT